MPCFVYVTGFSIRDAINNLNINSDSREFSIDNVIIITIKQVKIHFWNKEIIKWREEEDEVEKRKEHL